ncbi:MAG: DNA-protecting protein DprA [Fibromonadaceae bacterium]|jgi:DNA processing protein|nr:DNA-protecting protein DprA [Fibromonadaceae bacterium]
MFKNHEIREIKIDSPEYPALLKKSRYAVPLWIVGENFRDEFCLAMVGTRTPSGLAASSVKSMVKTLKNRDVRIVSGLAQGIDSLCHVAAVDNGLPTTAVIAQGLDVPLQSSQKILAEKILKLGGNIITPYAPGTKAYLSSFVKRNTIISGISNATLIVESRLKGGAMHTANFCIRENKPLLAMPGSPMNPTSEGCNFLIYKKRAQIVWSAKELPEILGLNSLFPLSTYSTSRTPVKTELPNWVTEGTILQINDICEQSEKSVNEVLTMLTELEILGKCRVNGQNVIFL